MSTFEYINSIIQVIAKDRLRGSSEFKLKGIVLGLLEYWNYMFKIHLHILIVLYK